LPWLKGKVRGGGGVCTQGGDDVVNYGALIFVLYSVHSPSYSACSYL
jgi:hypothetical protein